MYVSVCIRYAQISEYIAYRCINELQFVVQHQKSISTCDLTDLSRSLRQDFTKYVIHVICSIDILCFTFHLSNKRWYFDWYCDGTLLWMVASSYKTNIDMMHIFAAPLQMLWDTQNIDDLSTIRHIARQENGWGKRLTIRYSNAERSSCAFGGHFKDSRTFEFQKRIEYSNQTVKLDVVMQTVVRQWTVAVSFIGGVWFDNGKKKRTC